MDISKRFLITENFYMGLRSGISLKKGDRFGTASRYNLQTKNQDLFYVDLETGETRLITKITYDKLLNQSKPVP